MFSLRIKKPRVWSDNGLWQCHLKLFIKSNLTNTNNNTNVNLYDKKLIELESRKFLTVNGRQHPMAAIAQFQVIKKIKIIYKNKTFNIYFYTKTFFF